jgi:hypothetical protein
VAGSKHMARISAEICDGMDVILNVVKQNSKVRPMILLCKYYNS